MSENNTFMKINSCIAVEEKSNGHYENHYIDDLNLNLNLSSIIAINETNLYCVECGQIKLKDAYQIVIPGVTKENFREIDRTSIFYGTLKPSLPSTFYLTSGTREYNEVKMFLDKRKENNNKENSSSNGLDFSKDEKKDIISW